MRRHRWLFFVLLGVLATGCTVALCIAWHQAHSYERLLVAIRQGDLAGVRREVLGAPPEALARIRRAQTADDDGP